MKRFYYSFFAAFSICLVIFAMAFVKAKNEHADKHLEIVLRNMGHQLLLHSRDSTSRVLPVQMVNNNTFQISFENGFGFTPDTLMKLVHQQLATTDMPKDYTVSVHECFQNQTIFAYEVNTAAGNVKPCGGRKLKKGCYIIEISFFTRPAYNYTWLLVAFVPLALFGVYLTQRRNKPVPENRAKQEAEGEPVSGKDEPVSCTVSGKDEAVIPKQESVPEVVKPTMIGSFRFNETKGTLCLNGQTIELSEKEAKAIAIFASNQNMVVERELFRKTIWEDEGVVVITRNVDVLISKLRKKLSADPSVRIVNVHGKGYKLVTG